MTAEEMVSRYKAGASGKQIADASGKSVTWVYRVLARAGVARRPPGPVLGTPSRPRPWHAVAQTVLDRGGTVIEACEAAGMGVFAGYYAVRMGHLIRRPIARPVAPWIATAQALLDRGATLDKAGAAVGLTRQAIGLAVK